MKYPQNYFYKNLRSQSHLQARISANPQSTNFRRSTQNRSPTAGSANPKRSEPRTKSRSIRSRFTITIPVTTVLRNARQLRAGLIHPEDFPAARTINSKVKIISDRRWFPAVARISRGTVRRRAAALICSRLGERSAGGFQASPRGTVHPAGLSFTAGDKYILRRPRYLRPLFTVKSGELTLRVTRS